MRIEDVKGYKKARNYRILKMFMEGHTQSAIGKKFGITQVRVNGIIYDNKDLIKYDRELEKSKRIAWLKSQLLKSGDTKRDPVDIQEQLRKEIEGDKSHIDNSQHTHITYHWQTDRDSVQTSEIPRRDT